MTQRSVGGRRSAMVGIRWLGMALALLVGTVGIAAAPDGSTIRSGAPGPGSASFEAPGTGGSATEAEAARPTSLVRTGAGPYVSLPPTISTAAQGAASRSSLD